jgi:hypothetical protein
MTGGCSFRRTFLCAAVAVVVMTTYSVLLDMVFLHRPQGLARGCPLPHFTPDLAFRRNATADDLYDTTIGLGRDAGHTYGGGDFAHAAPRFSVIERAAVNRFTRDFDDDYNVDAYPPVYLRVDCSPADNRSEPFFAVSQSAIRSLELPPFAQRFVEAERVQLEHRNASFTVDVWCRVNDVLMRNRNFVVRRDPYIANAVRARRRRLGVQERFLGRASRSNARPLNVVLVIIDSLADAHFRRTMSQTVRLLQRVERSQTARIFRFDRYHVLGWHSDQNQPAIYAGSIAVSQPHILTRRAGSVLFGASRSAAPFQCDDLLWSRYAKLGYLTAEADCRCEIDDLLKYGRHLSSAHCGGRNITEIIDVTRPGHYFCGPLFPGYTDHRHKVCARDNIRMTHDVLRAYDDLPVFASIYLEELHGARAGAFASHVDPQMASALEDAIDMFNDSLVVFVSDHGLHFGRHLETLEGQIEHKLPLLHISAPLWWLERHGDASAALEHNQRVLTHHYDLHAMLEHLARIDELYYETHRTDGGHRVEPAADAAVPARPVPPKANATRNEHAIALGAMYAAESLPARWPPQANVKSWATHLSLGLWSDALKVTELVPFTTMPPLEQQQSPIAISLFNKVPEERDCDSAAIPTTLCVCANVEWENVTMELNKPKSVDEEEAALAALVSTSAVPTFFANLMRYIFDDLPIADDYQRLAVIAVSHINNKTRTAGSVLKSAMPCGQIQLHSIQAASLRQWVKSGGSAGRLVRLLLRTAPSGAMFEADLWLRAWGAFVWATQFTGGVDVVRVTRVSGMDEADKVAFDRYKELALREANLTIMGNALDSGLVAVETTFCVDSLSPDVKPSDRRGPLTDFFVRHQDVTVLDRHTEIEKPVFLPPRAIVYSGCFRDQTAGARLFPRFMGSGFTPYTCVERCTMARKPVAGIQLGSECWCSDDAPSSSTWAPPEECNACANVAQYLNCTECAQCGGSLRMAVYTRRTLPIAELARVWHVGCTALPNDAPITIVDSLDRAFIAPRVSGAPAVAGVNGWTLVGVRGYIATTCVSQCATIGTAAAAGLAIGQNGACWCLSAAALASASSGVALVTPELCSGICAQPTTLPCGGSDSLSIHHVSIFKVT